MLLLAVTATAYCSGTRATAESSERWRCQCRDSDKGPVFWPGVAHAVRPWQLRPGAPGVLWRPWKGGRSSYRCWPSACKTQIIEETWSKQKLHSSEGAKSTASSVCNFTIWFRKGHDHYFMHNLTLNWIIQFSTEMFDQDLRSQAHNYRVFQDTGHPEIVAMSKMMQKKFKFQTGHPNLEDFFFVYFFQN